MLGLKEGWTDGDREKRWRWPIAHKFLASEPYPICRAWRYRSELYDFRLFKKPPPNACKNCLRIAKANKKKGR